MDNMYPGKGSVRFSAALAVLMFCAAARTVCAQDMDWEPIQQIEPGPPTESVIAERPRIASDGRGNVVSVYGAKGNGVNSPDASQVGVQVLRSNTNGVSWNLPAVQLSAGATGVRPDIATDGLGNWLAAWHPDAVPSTGISTALSVDNGNSWIATGAISAAYGAQLANHSNVTLATNRNGTWVAAWLADDVSNSTATVAVAKSADNGSSWQPVALVSGATASAAPSIAAHPGQGFLVAYETEAGPDSPDNSEIAYAKFSSSGVLVDRGTVNTDAPVDSRHDFAPSVTVSSSGNWAVSWARRSTIDASQWRVSAASSSDGVNWSAPRPLSFPPGTNFSSAALADPSSAYGDSGRLVSLWTSEESSTDVPRDVFYNFQRTSPFEINQTRVDLDFGLLTNPYFVRPHVIQAAGGRWLALWQRLETLPSGESLSASSPWYSHGLETGLSAADSATTTDLSIVKTAWPETAAANADLGYVITVKNNGDAAANLVSVTDVLPTNVTFNHAVSSQGSWSHGTVNGQERVVAQLGSIAPGARATLALAVVPTATSGEIVNTATTDFFGTDLDPANNTATKIVNIGGSVPPPPPLDEPKKPLDPLPGNPDTPGEEVSADLLQLTASNVKISGKPPKPGKPAKPYKVSLKAQLANITTAATPAMGLEVYLSDDVTLDASDVRINAKGVKSVKPGKALKMKLSQKVDGNPTGRYLLLVVSGQDPVAVPLF